MTHLPFVRSPRAGPARSARAFTVIELMTVVLIVGVLAGLLLPALGAARQSAMTVQCASNLGQLGRANFLYARANNGFFVPAHTNFLRNRDRWHGVRPALDKPFDPAAGPLRSFLGADGAVKACPCFTGYLTGAEAFEAGCGGYGYNNSYIGSSMRSGRVAGRAAMDQPATIEDIRNAPRKIMFADAAFLASGGDGSSGPRLIEYSFIEPPVPGLQPSMHFRHRGRIANVCWADGHVASVKFGFSTERFEPLDIGWPGTDADEALRLFVRD